MSGSYIKINVKKNNKSSFKIGNNNNSVDKKNVDELWKKNVKRVITFIIIEERLNYC